jgi:hypothetical protein
MQNRRAVHHITSGDIVFTNFSFDVQSLANAFSLYLQGPRFIFNFTVDLNKAKGKETGWKTVIDDESIETRTLAHFEIIYTEQCHNLLLGVVEDSDPFDFSTHVGGGQGKSMYISNKSLYATQFQISDKQEFSFVALKFGDKVGLFFDMREQNNGRMFLTHNGSICGQMFRDLQTPVHAAFSYSKNLVRGELNVTATNNSSLPIGWNEPKYRDDGYVRKINPKVYR